MTSVRTDVFIVLRVMRFWEKRNIANITGHVRVAKSIMR